jgi:hypothetical protein
MGTLGASRLITTVPPYLTRLRVQDVTVAEDTILVAVTPTCKTAASRWRPCAQQNGSVSTPFISANDSLAQPVLQGRLPLLNEALPENR